MSTTTIFWPLGDDDRDHGICYGWPSTGRLCVAGTFHRGLTLEDAQRRLAELQCHRQPPTILDMPPDRSKYNIVYYHRHPSDSLRFYDIGNDSPRLSSGLDSRLIAQLNLAHQIHCLVNGAPVKLHKPTATVLLRVAATVIRPLLSVVHALRLPFVARLMPHSAFGKQLKTRASHVDSLLHGIDRLSNATHTMPISEYSQHYTSFFNELWLIINDITLGVAFGTFMCENSTSLASMATPAFKTLVLENVEAALVWLDSWPAGLKLNTELSHFYSRAFISLVHYWAGFLNSHVLNHVSALILVCGYISIFGGLTLAISLIIDMLQFMVTPHITLCYWVSCLVYSAELAALRSLWGLFQGKRYNALRNRMDAWDYDIDQLLFGTMLFTLFTFLSPTTLVYYFLFASYRLVSLLIQAFFEVCLAFMNHFPLFKLMLNVKDSSRIPDTVYLELVHLEGNEDKSLVLKSQAKKLGSIFDKYIYLWNALLHHYNPLRLGLSVFRGLYLASFK